MYYTIIKCSINKINKAHAEPRISTYSIHEQVDITDKAFLILRNTEKLKEEVGCLALW